MIYTGNKGESSANSVRNSLEFMIENSIKNMVNTAILVRVENVDSRSGKLSCRSLVSQYDASNNVLDSSTLYEIPYMRYQGGKVGIICTPCVGDIGIAIFAQQDISLVSSNRVVQPASFRCYDMADGLYIGGFLNAEPETFIQLDQEGTIHIKGAQVSIEAENLQIEGAVQIKGALEVSEDVTAGAKSLLNHVHGGIYPGSGFTGKAV